MSLTPCVEMKTSCDICKGPLGYVGPTCIHTQICAACADAKRALGEAPERDNSWTPPPDPQDAINRDWPKGGGE